jgi:cytochrome c553
MMPVHYRGLLLAALLAVYTLSVAQPVGDPVRGKQLATECFACHGPDGNSPSPVNPRIGGQHEQYILLAMQAYLDGTRSNSLMRGAILNKSEQDLRDIAAYYAMQKSALAQPAAAPGAPPAGGPPGPGGPPGGGVMKFDHGERASEFISLLARARGLADAARPADAGQACSAFNGSPAADRDADGLADAYDAAPANANEFVADTDGDGRYEICHAEQLQAIATLGTAPGKKTALSTEQRLARSYELVRDLDLGAIENFEPIGDCGPTGNCMRALGEFGFAGVFDGLGHQVRGLRIDLPERGGVGLFGVLGESGVVMNLRLVDARVNGRAGTGALVGSNFGVVFGCQSEGEVTAAMALGGLVGGSGGLVYGSRSAGRVSGQQAVGGLVGDMTGAVFASSSAAEVKGERGIGGLVGLNTFGAIDNSRAAGPVSGKNDVGGLVGVNTDARVRVSAATGPVTGSGNNVGGLAGFNSLSTVRNSYATGEVSGSDAVGGLVGRNNGQVSRSFAAGKARADGASGPLIGTVVEGTEHQLLAGDGARDATQASAWSPEELPVTDLLDYFCDRNENGYIDPAERAADNYVWRVSAGQYPTLNCGKR